MGKFALVLLGAGLASAGVIFPIPDPFRWDESFTVEMPQMDDEHRGLFNGVLLIESANTAANLNAAKIKFKDHFALEESLFKQTMSNQYTKDHTSKHTSFLTRCLAWSAPVPTSEAVWAKNWLVQHIKNTDFKYKGGLPHAVPKPFNWDESFETFYNKLDDQHLKLFDAIRVMGQNLASSKDLATAKSLLRAHFDYERGFFCNSATYTQCEEHAKRHDNFFKTIYAVQAPIDENVVNWAKNWLVQHIKNTDFQYKHKLNNYIHEVPRPYVWQKTFAVNYEQMDTEHVKLFKAIKESIEAPEDAAKYADMISFMEYHFANEEAEFTKVPNFGEYSRDHVEKHRGVVKLLKANSVPLDCDFINYVETWLVQHIKNTDFSYRAKFVNAIPSPYVWDESFMTFYKRLDHEHKGLFDCVNAVANDNANAEKYAACRTLLRMHFDYEESEFCKIPNYDCYGHYLKHYNFQTAFQGAGLPLSADVTAFAKNWLVQHIKNTDFAYRGKLNLRNTYVVPDPFVWDTSFLVDVKELDDEHIELFKQATYVVENPNSQAVFDKAVEIYNAHFRNEEGMFSKITDVAHDIASHRLRHLGLMNTIKGAEVPITKDMTDFITNWLVQHIKNTDFTYKGKMPIVHPVPNPFKWTQYFAVLYPDMDNQHKNLFSCIAGIGDTPGDAAVVGSCKDTVVNHFNDEIKLLSEAGDYPASELYQHKNKHAAFVATIPTTLPVHPLWVAYAKNWLTQHIANTDFQYKNKLPFVVNNPYVWDESFAVFYDELDAQHQGLFDAMQKMVDNPDSVDVLNNNRDVFRDHFDYEESQFLACGEACDADAHKKKHDIVFKTLTWVTTPVSQEYANFAMNWLTQHIKNTDFKYRYKLPTQHKVPEPFAWNTDFEVSYPKLDQEHVGLFAALYDVEMNIFDQEKVEVMQKLMRDHFYYEETQFCDSPNVPWDYCKEHKKKHAKFSEKLETLTAPIKTEDLKWGQNWLAQHIRNTDFGYKGSLKHVVPEPYVWDISFKTEYTRLDSEHNTLFANVLAVSQNPNDAGLLQVLKGTLETHFAYEEARFCAVPNFNCVDHKMKHYKFWVIMEDQQVPIGCEEINWAKSWLANHIKNTDHQYKARMVGPDSGVNFTGA